MLMCFYANSHHFLVAIPPNGLGNFLDYKAKFVETALAGVDTFFFMTKDKGFLPDHWY